MSQRSAPYHAADSVKNAFSVNSASEWTLVAVGKAHWLVSTRVKLTCKQLHILPAARDDIESYVHFIIFRQLRHISSTEAKVFDYVPSAPENCSLSSGIFAHRCTVQTGHWGVLSRVWREWHHRSTAIHDSTVKVPNKSSSHQVEEFLIVLSFTFFVIVAGRLPIIRKRTTWQKVLGIIKFRP